MHYACNNALGAYDNHVEIAMKLCMAAVLMAFAASAAADEKDLRTIPLEVLSAGAPIPVPLLDRPLPAADALSSTATVLMPNVLQANTTQMGAVSGANISNLGQSIPGAMGPAGPAITNLGNTVAPPRLR